MSEQIDIRLLVQDEIAETLPLIQLLNPDIALEVLHARLHEMLQSGYKCIGVFIEQHLVACCGFWILHKYYVGKHIEPDNVVVDPAYRNLQIGERMMQWLGAYAMDIKCEAMELNVYVKNEAGQHFWTEQGFTTLGLHMQKKI